MPVSHSHQFLWVPVRFPMTGLFPETVRTGSGLLRAVTSQTSGAELANPRSMYTLLSRIGSVLPSHTRTNWAPPLVGVAGGVTGVPTGMWTRNFGRRGSETSRIEVPFGSFLPVIRLNEDRKSTRLNSSHQIISYAVFCLKKKKIHFTIKQNSSRTTSFAISYHS